MTTYAIDTYYLAEDVEFRKKLYNNEVDIL
jgi:hypothetical protein